MTLGEIMKANVLTVEQDETVEVVRDLFEWRRFHHLLVTDQGVLIGVISDRDLLKNVSPFLGKTFGERPQDVSLMHRRAHQIMTRKPVTASAGTPVEEGARRMLQFGISCLPVVDDRRRPVGIVTTRDLLQLLVTGSQDRTPVAVVPT